MATKLRLIALTVTTADSERTYRFAHDLTVISGPVATGKSTLLMLIKYALGGNAVLTPAVVEHVRYVTLEVDFGDEPQHLRLRRHVQGDRSRVQLLEHGSDIPEQHLTVPARTGEETVSRHLLAALGIDAHRVPKSRGRSAKGEFTTVGFGDVFGYCYLQAKTIDSSATGHLDSGRDSKRKTVFELLFGMIDPEVFDLREQRDKLTSAISERDSQLKAIRIFVEGEKQSTFDELRALRWDKQEAFRHAERALQELRTDVDALVRQDRDARNELLQTLSRASATREAVVSAHEVVRAREAALAQCRLDLKRSDKATVATNLLGPFEFVTCPRCLQDVAHRTVHSGDCALCLQPQPTAVAAIDDSSRVRLATRVEEMEQLLRVEQEAVRTAELRAAEADLAAATAQRHYDELTREAVSPRVQAVAAASANVEGLRRELLAIDQRIATWNRMEQFEKETNRLRDRKRELTTEIKRWEQELKARRSRLDEISRLFALEVAHIGVRVNGTPTIDDKTYLPMIGGTSLETVQASGGGSTTAINVAFSLALLNYALREPSVQLPNLLILDSPRKGIGSVEPEDVELGQNIYKRFKTLADALAGRGQLIIADNNAELRGERDVELIALTRKASAVPGIENTGVGTQLRVEEHEEIDEE
ncbi:AAA family ATPase [Lentzea sp. NEAU-D13]|uniref:AAA family ATPase n=1 Tax=Lentzea alba TaxID=2714351 RepID=A0A7C9W8M9_9PSEU|nr:ATP-binding protein [Lentzea alba]NGY65340.1 AAA family ATPase [Lentzea alba]